MAIGLRRLFSPPTTHLRCRRTGRQLVDPPHALLRRRDGLFLRADRSPLPAGSRTAGSSCGEVANIISGTYSVHSVRFEQTRDAKNKWQVDNLEFAQLCFYRTCAVLAEQSPHVASTASTPMLTPYPSTTRSSNSHEYLCKIHLRIGRSRFF